MRCCQMRTWSRRAPRPRPWPRPRPRPRPRADTEQVRKLVAGPLAKLVLGHLQQRVVQISATVKASRQGVKNMVRSARGVPAGRGRAFYTHGVWCAHGARAWCMHGYVHDACMPHADALLARRQERARDGAARPVGLLGRGGERRRAALHGQHNRGAAAAARRLRLLASRLRHRAHQLPAGGGRVQGRQGVATLRGRATAP